MKGWYKIEKKNVIYVHNVVKKNENMSRKTAGQRKERGKETK